MMVSNKSKPNLTSPRALWEYDFDYVNNKAKATFKNQHDFDEKLKALWKEPMGVTD